MLFPSGPGVAPRTTLELDCEADGLPRVTWLGLATTPLATGTPIVTNGPGMPLLGEHAHGRYTRPHLRGHRVHDGRAGASWTTHFATDSLTATDDRLVLDASDARAGLAVMMEFESLNGGSLRARCTVTNTASAPYVVDGLDVVLPVDDDLIEVLDFTGRHERERTPQRHELTDGLWLREGRQGRPGLDAAMMAVLGTAGFSTTRGRVVGAHVGWSGNSVLRVERDAASGTTLGGGELLLPGEVVLAKGERYTTPWVYVAAADDGLDGLAAAWHSWQRTLAAHPKVQPTVLNVWEAVYFDHDLERLSAIADRAARVGIERFVLDDGWFRHRRDDSAGLGDWWVDEGVWPDGLAPLIDRVHELGMGFGLWFEPEMANPDSDILRAHPDWILAAASDRWPLEHRQQQVLDLTQGAVYDYLYGRMSAILRAHAIDYVKWDHNRDLLEAGTTDGTPAVHAQTVAFYRLLDQLRAEFPHVSWESCASGGGRIDLGVLERVQRVWSSDMTDALARQQIQRWTAQLVAPEYVGQHVSAHVSHTTGRTFDLDFRCATALFGAFGIEWDLTEASDDDLDRLADWVDRHKRWRRLLHAGRVVRPESSDPTVLLHGVIASDKSAALMAHVAMEESAHNRGVWIRVPGLDEATSYRLEWEGPLSYRAVSMSSPPPRSGPTDGIEVSGAMLARRGFWIPRRRPETVTLVALRRT